MKDPRLAKEYEFLGETPAFRSGRDAYSDMKAAEKQIFEINKLMTKR